MNIPPYQWRAGLGYLPPTNGGPCFAAPGPYIGPTGFGGGGGWMPVPSPNLGYGYPPPPPPPPQQAPASAPAIPATTLSGGLRPGMHYLFPSKHTHIHLIRATPGQDPRTPGNAGRNLDFRLLKVACGVMTVKELIALVGGGGDDDMALTEVFEKGNGSWDKGVTIKKSEAKSDEVLEKQGWTEKRGSGQPPVWLVLHRP